MRRIAMTIAGASAAAVISFGVMAETRIVIDAPDVQKLGRQDHGASVSEIIGADVYGNGGKRIGEVEDFRIAKGGHLYAVIDVAKGPLDGALELTDDELVVVPFDQLRTVTVQQ